MTTDVFEETEQLLDLTQAAAALGKSVRSLERSLLGKWGNKLPEGWKSRKVQTEQGSEWRLIPPASFVLPQSAEGSSQNDHSVKVQNSELSTYEKQPSYKLPTRIRHSVRKTTERNYAQQTIVIDRSEEVEYLLRDLLSTQKVLSEERRLHMEDLRIIAQLQGSLRLIEANASENNRVKQELENAQKELAQLKRDYNHLADLPWWKRLFLQINPKQEG